MTQSQSKQTKQGQEFSASIPDSSAIMNGEQFHPLNVAQRMSVLVRLPQYLTSIRATDSDENKPEYQCLVNGKMRHCRFTAKESENLFNFLLKHFPNRAESAAMVRAISRNEGISLMSFQRTESVEKWAKRHRYFMRGTC
jgi:hypothetical protein